MSPGRFGIVAREISPRSHCTCSQHHPQTVLGMIMGEEKDVSTHSLYVRILLDKVMVFQLGIECGSEKCSVSVKCSDNPSWPLPHEVRNLWTHPTLDVDL